MSVNLSMIETQLVRPGRTLVFIDETEFQGHEVTDLVPDLRVVAAIKFASDHYLEVRNRMAERLEQLGAREFHASEIVNPKRQSIWGNVELSERIQALNLLSSLIEECEASMRYVWVSKDDYSNVREQMQERGMGDPCLDRNSALKRVALRSLLNELLEEGKPAAIVVDQDRPLASIEIDRSENAPWLIGGGVLTAPSHLIHGIQLADGIAYAIGRRFRKSTALEEGTASELDKAAIGILAALNGRSASLF